MMMFFETVAKILTYIVAIADVLLICAIPLFIIKK